MEEIKAVAQEAEQVSLEDLFEVKEAARRADLTRRAARAKERARKERWAEPARSQVTHPDHGAVTVPHGSNFSAILCAAEVWGVDWTALRGAEVTRI